MLVGAGALGAGDEVIEVADAARRRRRQGAARQGGRPRRPAVRDRLDRPARHQAELGADDGLRHAADGRLELPVLRVPARGGPGARRADRHRRRGCSASATRWRSTSSATRARRCARCCRCSSARTTAPGARRSRPSVERVVEADGGARASSDADPINPQRVFWELSPRLPDSCILTADSGSAANWFARDLQAARGHDGVAVGNAGDDGAGRARTRSRRSSRYPDRPVIALVGDGAMQMNGINELITVAKYWQRWSDPRLDRARAQQPRPQPGDVGAARDGGRPAVRGVAGAARLPVRALRRADRPARHPRRRARRRSATAWDEALAADRPVVLEAIVDPEVPPLPPHITFEQATALRPGRAPRRPGARRDDPRSSFQPAARRVRSRAGDRRAASRSRAPRSRRLDRLGVHDPDRRARSPTARSRGTRRRSCVVEVAAGGERGLGYTYAPAGAPRAGRATCSRRRSRGTTRSTPARAQVAMRARGPQPRRPGVGAMAISAVDVALWDLKARLLERLARDAARRRRATRCRSTAAAASPPTRDERARRAARRLGRAGDPAGEDEGRPRPGRRPRTASRPRARRSATTPSCSSTPTARSPRKQALAHRRAASPSIGVELVRGAGQLGRPRRAAAAARPRARPGWTSPPASTATTLGLLPRCSRRRGRLCRPTPPAAAASPACSRRPRSPRRHELDLSAPHARRRSTRTRCCAVPNAAPPRVVPRPRRGSSACSSTASSSPSDGARCGPIRARPGLGVELKRADAERYAV